MHAPDDAPPEHSPAWFPVLVDASRAELGFLASSREALAAAPFLDQRFTAGRAPRRRPLAALAPCAPATAPAFVFHTAFCCSTLLATALDAPGVTLSLKEPDVLMQLANLRRVAPAWRDDDERFAALVRTVCGLLGRRFAAEECVLVKPTNAANLLLPWVVAEGAPVLLLHADLKAFLVSVLKKGEAGRWFVRHLFNILRLDRPDIAGWPERERMLLTDLQVAALVWQMQVEQFEAVLNGGAGPLAADATRVRTLDAAAFLAEPRAVLGAVSAHLGLGHAPALLDAAVRGPAFSRHAKFADVDYDASQRAAEQAEIEAQHGEALAVTLEWARRLRGGRDAPDLTRYSVLVGAASPPGASR